MQIKNQTRRVISILLIISAFFLYAVTPVMAEASQLNNERDKKILQSESKDSTKANKSKKKSTNRFIVKYKENKEKQGKEKIEKSIKQDIKNIKKLKKSEKQNKKQKFDLITTNNKMDYDEVLQKLQLDPNDTDIEYIQPDYEISLDANDTYYPQQWALGEEAGIASAWENTKGKDVLVAVIDTGIDTNHEDLLQNIWINRNEIPGNGIDDDGNGYIDDVSGWNFNDATNILYTEGSADANHGTHIAGIIAAVKDNGKGIVGAAPEAKIMPLKVFNNGVAYTSDIMEAIEYASDMGAKVVNCSWGGFDENPALREVIEGNDMLFVCAAGNNGLNIEAFPMYPAAYNSENIISVASTNRNGDLSAFSNYGENLVHVGAPGEEIISTLPGNNYGELSGTSMAAPFVSAEAALIISTYENITSNEIKGKIIESSDKLSALAGKVYEGNRINGKNAVLGLMGESNSSQETTNGEGTAEENSQNENSTSENPTPDEVTDPNQTPEDNSTTDPGNEESVEAEEPTQSDKFLDLDEILADKTIGKILERRNEYSDAKDKEKSAILEHFKIEEDILVQSEKRGYSLVDSILVGIIVKNYDFTLDEIEKLLDIYINIETIYRQIDKYEVFKNDQQLSVEVAKEAKGLILEGYLLNRIESAYKVAKTSEHDIKSIIDDKEKSGNFETLTTIPEEEKDPMFYDAPFDFRRNGKEYIQAGKGSLSYQDVDFSLPGRNGLDLNIVTRYQMSDATTFKHVDQSTNKHTGDDPFGLGWTLGFSAIYDLNGGDYLRLSTGEVYPIKLNGDLTTYTIEDYDLNDIKLAKDDKSFSNGQEDSRYVLTYKNGKKEYFGYEGNLLGIVDRNGNTIKFEHKYSGRFPLITKIIDTLGRSIDISYLDYVAQGTRKTVITLPDASTIEFLLEEIPDSHTAGTSINLYKLVKKIDQEGRETDFSCSIRETYYQTDVRHRGDIVTINRITYPTSGTSYYNYEKATVTGEGSSYTEYYRITSRYDYIAGVRYNEDTYSYIGDYAASGIEDWEILKNYTYSTIITDDSNTQRVLTFKKHNPDGRKIKEEIKENGTTLLKEINYGYNSDNLPTKKETISYNPTAGTSMTKETLMAYDSGKYGDLIEYTDELGHKTTYTYDSNFHRLESEERNINSSDYQKKVYQIDPITGNVNKAIQHYLDNGALRFLEADYIYDSYGNIISEKTQIEDGSYITKNYEYGAEYQYGYLTKVYSDVEGYDLSNLTKTSETVDEAYGYDFETGNQLAYMDKNGKTTLYYYDKLGRTKEIKNLETNESIIINYDDQQNIITVTDEEGNQAKQIYDELGRLLKKQEVKDGVWITPQENHYNSLSQIDWVKDGTGNKTSFEYDALGRQTKTTNPDSTDITIIYDDGENSKTIENEEGDPQKYYYDKLGDLIKEEVKPDKNGSTIYTTNYSYDFIGNMTSKTDANSSQTKYSYDNMSRLVSVTEPYDKMNRYEYTHLGNLKKITTGLSATGEGYKLSGIGSNNMSELLNSMMVTQSTGSGHIFFNHADIRDYNNAKFSGVSHDESGIPFGEERSYTIDVIKNDTDGNEFEIVSARVYDLDELFNTNPTPFENYIYTSEEKSNGTVSYTQRLTEEHDTVVVVFVYEQKDNTAPQGSIVTREYDELGRLIKETDPLNKDVYIDYDKASNITGKRDKKGQITTFNYDDRNRLLNQYAGAVTTSYTYDKAGKIKSMNDATGITNYTYYDNGRLKRQTEPDGKYIEYDYDKNGNMTQTTDYFGKVTAYGYDNRNRLKTVTVDGETTTYLYHPDGARNYIVYPGGIGTEYIYDGLNNLKTLKNVEFSGVINEFSYTYDGVGNQLTKVDENGTTSYTYDKLNRLKTVAEPDGNQVTYNFDDNGNIKTKDLVHPSNYTYTFKQGGAVKEMNGITSHTISYNNDASNKLNKVTEILDNTGAVSSPYVGTATITVDLDYDDNGNLITTTKGGSADTEISSYKYNQLNQMTEYTSPSSVITSYGYNGNGLRKTKTSGSNTTGFYYSGGNVINETENGAFKTRNIRGINIIAREDNAGTKAYYLYNGHGDTVNLVTSTGDILNTYDYDVYGKEKVATEGSLKNPYRYAGEYYDEESELYYLRARYYDPNIARFISEDSYKGDANYPLSLNLYTYTYNNPIKYVDPSGHRADTLAGPSPWITLEGIGTGISSAFKAGASKLLLELEIFLLIWNGRKVKGGESEGEILYGENGDMILIGEEGMIMIIEENNFPDDVVASPDGKTVKSNKGNDYDIESEDEHSSTTSVPNPKSGTQNSSVDILDKKTGKIKTRRFYGEDGRATRDVDFGHHGNAKEHPEWPHEHSFEWNSDGNFKRVP